MANIGAFHELNTINTTQEDIDETIREYFEDMELPEEEIRERILTATDLQKVFRSLFVLALAMQKVDDVQEEWLMTYAQSATERVLDKYDYDFEDTYYDNYLQSGCKGIVDTTLMRMADDYYTSVGRSVLCAVDITNTVANYKREQEMIRRGFRYKTWFTRMDGKERKTHKAANGQTVGIFDAFEIGANKMMFPKDLSLGAELKECVNCRCSLRYSTGTLEERIEEGKRGKKYPITQNSIDNANKNSVSSINGVDFVTKSAKDTLEYAFKENYSNEVAIYYDNVGKEIARNIGTEHGVDLLNNGAFSVFHNHPNCESFSLSDIFTFSRMNKLQELYVVRNNGIVSKISKKEDFSFANFETALRRSLKKNENLIAQNEENGYDKVVAEVLSDKKVGIVLE